MIKRVVGVAAVVTVHVSRESRAERTADNDSSEGRAIIIVASRGSPEQSADQPTNEDAGGVRAITAFAIVQVVVI